MSGTPPDRCFQPPETSEVLSVMEVEQLMWLKQLERCSLWRLLLVLSSLDRRAGSSEPTAGKSKVSSKTPEHEETVAGHPVCHRLKTHTLILNELNNFFGRFEELNSNPARKVTPQPDEQALRLETSAVRKVLRKVNAWKAAGPHNIPGRLIKECSDQLTHVLTDIFNMSLDQAVVPQCFKSATVVPVPKTTTITCFNDFCPVALTWRRFIESCKSWIDLDGRKKEIAETFSQYTAELPGPAELGYHRKCCSREENILDHRYTTISNTYHAVPRAALGHSDHIMVHLIPASRQKLKLCKPNVRTSKQWSPEAVEDLQACLETTDWDVFRTATTTLDEYTETVTSYISFCEDCCIPSRTRVSYNNDKPWFSPKLRQLRLQEEKAFRSGDRDKESKYRFSEAVRDAKRLYAENLKQQFPANDSASVWRGSDRSPTTNLNPPHSVNDLRLANKLNDFYCRFERQWDSPNTNTIPHYHQPLPTSIPTPTSEGACPPHNCQNQRTPVPQLP
ncbi:unnamed protein product [Menidia menidia]|uniref:(Atlantic silverside) hypothetical protein n=1 Tax=Menidia menidia TaxID=238744 RepID=A0A8S4AMJ4_9TELE|nr:unnamed protein product [Menidia menidia]